MADPVQPSFSTLARAVGGRYDPTTPRGQELLKQDMLNEAMRAEAQRAAKSAMEERKALQYIQQESARPSRQEAPGVRSIFKDGRLVGYSTMPEAREAAEPAPQRKPMGTALEQGFISALKRADASKAARDAAEKAKASGKPMPQEVEETITEKVVEKPAPAIPGDVFGAGFLPMGENNPFAQTLNSTREVQIPLTRALERLKNLTAPQAVASPQQKEELKKISSLYQSLRQAQEALSSGRMERPIGRRQGEVMTIPADVTPQDRAELQQQVDSLVQQIRDANAATSKFGVAPDTLKEYESLRRTMALMGLPISPELNTPTWKF